MELTNILPNFTLGMLSPDNGNELSAIFIFVLMSVFFFFLVSSLISYNHARIRINWVNSQLKGQTSSSVLAGRFDHEENALQLESNKNKDNWLKRVITGDQSLAAISWLEFNETLVETKSIEGSRLQNTMDAGFFFNTISLAGGITESRLLAAVPGFLTALGVIGTFIGLQLGLSELKIGSGVDIEEMKNGLASVISGASIAFMTSIWGVGLSVLFNVIEKNVEKSVRKDIFILQNKIDRLYPRLSAEGQLQRIADDGQESRSSLQGLAEKIGDKMQETLLEATDGITSALTETLNAIMKPALDKLVNDTAHQSENALSDLVQKFLDGFGEVGKDQRAAVDDTSRKMNEALDGMKLAMASLVASLQDNQENAAEREKDLIRKISQQVDDLVEGSNAQQKQMADLLKSQLEGIATTSKDQQANANEREDIRDKRFNEQTTALSASTSQLLEHLKSTMEEQLKAGEALLAQGEALRIGLDKSTEASANSAKNIQESSVEMRNASDRLSGFGIKIQEVTNVLSESVTHAAETTAELADNNQQAIQTIKELRTQLSIDTTNFRQITEDVDGLIKSASTTFVDMREHQNQYLDGLDKNVSSLSEKMAELMQDYAKRANAQTEAHLNEWSKHTFDYSENMLGLVETMKTVIQDTEDLQSKMVGS